MRRNFKDELNTEKIFIADGAMGTELQKKGIKNGECPELLNAEKPELIAKIEESYVKAGADILLTNTFGGSTYKLMEYGLTNRAYELNKKGCEIARKAAGDDIYVAGSIGPLGGLLEPMGEITFKQAVKYFKEHAGFLIKDGLVDILAIETMTDILELKAAIVGIREISDLPIWASMTFEKDGKALTGTTPESFAILMNAMEVDIISTNCGTGPDDLYPNLIRLLKYAEKPVLIYPNSGLPQYIDGRTIYNMKPEEYVEHYKKLLLDGVKITGGCCGTTPEHISLLKNLVKDKNFKYKKNKKTNTAITSRASITLFGKYFIKIGEKINPTNQKKLSEEFKNSETATAALIARKQAKAGADLLDVNCGGYAIDEENFLPILCTRILSAIDIPLSIDSSNIKAIENALMIYPGKPLINSITAEKEKYSYLLPLIKKYGAAFIFLPISDNGIAKTITEKEKLIDLILKECEKYNIPKSDIIIDPLVFTISTDTSNGNKILNAIKMITNKYKIKTTCGLSNISFGMPHREIINSVFLSMAISYGLSSAIMDVLSHDMLNTVYAADLLTNHDSDGEEYIKKIIDKEKQNSTFKDEDETVYNAVLYGNKEKIISLIENELSYKKTAMEIIDNQMIPAIEKVGSLYGEGKYFLPQLISSAETMKNGFIYLRPMLKKDEKAEQKEKIVMATVQGDIHDIGKNIVSLMLENSGYTVLDLGKDVKYEEISRIIDKEKPDLIGLSALMTTTMHNMEKIIKRLKEEKKINIIVGGAVVTRSFAKGLGVYYAKDGPEAVKITKKIFKKK